MMKDCVFSAFKLIDSAFSLFSNADVVKDAAADDILPIFTYVVLKAKIERIWAYIKYLKIFSYNKGSIDAVAYVM